LKEAFEGQYGANQSIPSAVSTRWNSTLRLVEAVTDLDPQILNTLLEAQGHKGLCLSAREWSQLKELVEILAPFLQATDLTQGEKVLSRSHCNAVSGGSLQMSEWMTRLNLQEIFHLEVYMMSALLDPSFCFFWLEQDVLAPDEVKSEVKEMIMDLVLAEARKVTILAESSSGEDNKDEEPPAKTPRLFTGYRKKSKKKDDHVSSVKAELIRYIQVAPVERVFSHGGLIMRPHRARLSARTLSSLIFLKCNHSVA
ncbi:hypothetical protein KUCAC02_019734, partial [Chaenocephalus aceratus]